MNYDEKYFEERGIEQKHYRLALQWLSWLNKNGYVKDTTTLLDYGCGRGPFVHAFRYLGIDSTGYDVSSDAINGAVGRARNRISTTLPNTKFDIILCIDVMEHISPGADETKVLEDLTRLSKKKGALIMSICDTTLSKKYQDPTHCNIRTRNYWIYRLSQLGWKYLNTPEDWDFKSQMYLFIKD